MSGVNGTDVVGDIPYMEPCKADRSFGLGVYQARMDTSGLDPESEA